MKKGISVLATGILMMSLTACQGDVSEEFSKRYQRLESYTATAVVTVTGNKGTTVYEMKQSYRAPESYRLEVVKPEQLSGTVTIMNGQDLWMKSGETPAISLSVTGLEENTDMIFPVTVLNDYFREDNPQNLTENADGTILLTGAVQKANRYRMSQNLFFDGKSFLPTEMITYDENGNEAFRVEYRDFKQNVELDDGVFLP